MEILHLDYVIIMHITPIMKKVNITTMKRINKNDDLFCLHFVVIYWSHHRNFDT